MFAGLTDIPGDNNDTSTDSIRTTDVNGQPPPLPPSLKQTATNSPYGDAIKFTTENYDSEMDETTTKRNSRITSSTTMAKPTPIMRTAPSISPTMITPKTTIATLPTRSTPQTTISTLPPTIKVVVKATSTSIPTTTKQEVKKVETQIVPIQTGMRFKPVLQILTPSPPYRNATGVLKKSIDEVEPLPEIVNRLPKTDNKSKNDIVTDKGTSTESIDSVKYSKTYEYYSKNYPKTNESSTLNSKYFHKLVRATAATFEVTENDRSTSSKFLIKSERMTSYNGG